MAQAVAGSTAGELEGHSQRARSQRKARAAGQCRQVATRQALGAGNLPDGSCPRSQPLGRRRQAGGCQRVFSWLSAWMDFFEIRRPRDLAQAAWGFPFGRYIP